MRRYDKLQIMIITKKYDTNDLSFFVIVFFTLPPPINLHTSAPLLQHLTIMNIPHCG